MERIRKNHKEKYGSQEKYNISLDYYPNDFEIYGYEGADHKK